MAYNLDDKSLQPDETQGPAKISTAGIHHDIEFKGIAYNEFNDKKDSAKKYAAAEFNFETKDGLVHKELFFEPPQVEDDVKLEFDEYKKIDNKMVKTGAKFSKKEALKLLNNEIVYFMMDLGEALGYARDKMKATLTTAKSFKNLIEIFNKSFPASSAKRISIKLQYDNNDTKKTSFLKLHNKPLMYFPWMSDVFDIYVPGRTTILFINAWEAKNTMVKRHENNAGAPSSTAGTTQKGPVSGAQYVPVTGAVEDDPF